MFEEYFVSLDGLDEDVLLEDWRWIIGPKRIEIVAVAAVGGDLFLRGESGRVYLLSLDFGTCECIAESIDEYHLRLQERGYRRLWFQGHLIRILRDRGLILEAGQCYSQRLPSCFRQGSSELADFEAIDLMAHVSTLGRLYEQIRSLPPGSPVDDVKTWFEGKR